MMKSINNQVDQMINRKTPLSTSSETSHVLLEKDIDENVLSNIRQWELLLPGSSDEETDQSKGGLDYDAYCVPWFISE